MTTAKRTVELTDAQIAFLRTSLDYSAKQLHDATSPGLDPEHRRENDEMISAIRDALRAATA